jgi:hypothetical protein
MKREEGLLYGLATLGMCLGGPVGALVGAGVGAALGSRHIDNDQRKKAARLGCSKEQFDNLDKYDDNGRYRG